MNGRRGVGTTEYMLLLSVIVVGIVVAGYMLVPAFKEGVGLLANDVAAMLRGEGNGAVASREAPASESECPFVFDARTGRWHDVENDYLMVSFADAGAAGCSN